MRVSASVVCEADTLVCSWDAVEVSASVVPEVETIVDATEALSACSSWAK